MVQPISDILTGPEATPPSARAPHVPMTQREVNFAMVGLTMSVFVAMLSNLVVLTALPRIVADLRGTQASYTWIITASMLTITVCTPIWGRLSDILNKKRQLQICIAGYVASSICAGFAPAAWVIILCRVAIGVAAAGLIVLVQTISAQITTPRQRARWIGYRGAVMSVATLGAPSLGGFVAQHLGWRWCFFVGVPIAVAAIAMLQKTLRLPPPKAGATAQVDWVGAVLVATGIVAAMLWVSVVGPRSGWLSDRSIAMLALAIVMIGIAIAVERRVTLPILPLELFRVREVLLCAIASAGTGFAYFGSAVFLAIYLQIGRGLNPEIAGLMALPEAAATLLASLIASQFISRSGLYKAALVIGAAMVAAGFAILSTIGTATPLLVIGLCVALIGGGLGTISENLVLVVQTSVGTEKAGAAGALIAFFRILGGVLCVAVMGAILSIYVTRSVRTQGFPDYDGHDVPKIATLAAPLRIVVEAAYAHGTALVYLACVPTALAILVSVCLLHGRTLEQEHLETTG